MEKLGLNQPFQQILPSRWMKYFCSYLLCWESQRRYWYRSLWGQFLRTVLKYLEAIIYCLIISMQPKPSLSFSTHMPFTARPPHHQIQGTRNYICRWVGWRSEGLIHRVDLLLCGFPIIYPWEVSDCFSLLSFGVTPRWREASWNRNGLKGGGCLEGAVWLRHGWS